MEEWELDPDWWKGDGNGSLVALALAEPDEDPHRVIAAILASLPVYLLPF